MLLDTIKIFLCFTILILGINGAGLIVNNIVCGLIFFSFLIGTLLAINLYNIKIILFFIVIGLIFSIINREKIFNFEKKI